MMTILDMEYGYLQDFERIIYDFIPTQIESIISDIIDTILAELKSPQLKTDSDQFSVCGTLNNREKNINFILKSRFIDLQHSNEYVFVFNNKNNVVIKIVMMRFENLIHVTISVAEYEHDISFYANYTE